MKESMSSLRVLQVLPQLNRGGVERTTLDLVEALRKVSPVAYVACEKGELHPDLERLGGTHVDLPLATKNPIQIIRNARHLANLIRKHDIQLIHARSRAPAWSAYLAAKWTQIPLVTTYHGTYASSNAFKSLYNSVMSRGERVIAISDFIKQHIQSQHPSASPNIRLIYEGINTTFFNPQRIIESEKMALRDAWGIPPDATLFLLPGRLTRLKGHAIFIEALRHLKNTNVWGIILGQNSKNPAYVKEITDQAAGLPIKFISYTSDLPTAFASADFIVAPSLAPETFGRVVAEAGAMERIVIATNQGAAPEVCQDGRTGFLVPVGDPLRLAQAMEQALNLPLTERQAMENAARAHVCARFSADRMGMETIELYKELIK